MMFDDLWPVGLLPGRALVGWMIAAVALALLATAIVHDAQQRRWLWLVLDIAVPPFGAIRGGLIWMERI